MEDLDSHLDHSMSPSDDPDHTAISTALLNTLASTRVYLSAAGVFIALFGMGCVISIKDFSERENHLGKSVIIGLAFQSFIQPAIGYALALLLDMEENEALTMIMLAISPVSPLCAVLVYYGDGVVIVGLCLAMLSTALSVGLIPFWFSLYSTTWSHEYFVIAPPINIVLTEMLIFFPTLLGVMYQRRFGKLKGKLMAKICSFGFWIASIVSPIVNAGVNLDFYVVPWQIWVGAVCLPVIGFVCGLVFALFASLPFDVCSAISLAVGVPNVYIMSQISERYLSADPETLHDVHGIINIFSFIMPIEGFIWAILYRAIEEFFVKLTPTCCSGGDDDADDSDTKRLLVSMDSGTESAESAGSAT
ncbi:ileal sodium/bile acid cotransporter-like [Lytechinus variegatus]|uniref:ileal sodium/bile acid cotransporter-like n=1 Tax=Lytechinus variegatus TaxID=7654 RepID=UPI001BB18F03|nr:ileal sodium/bile acid cotransporter-like [Lytechinus variegatus]